MQKPYRSLSVPSFVLFTCVFLTCIFACRSLVSLLAHPNRLLASQALQLLLLATHPDMYDWHCPPGHSTTSSHAQQQQAPHRGAADAGSSSMQQLGSSSNVAAGDSSTSHEAAAAAADVSHPSQGPDAQLWLQLLQLHDGPLLPRLLALSPDAWPGSGYQALQLLAFYLSWLRAWWSKVRRCFVALLAEYAAHVIALFLGSRLHHGLACVSCKRAVLAGHRGGVLRLWVVVRAQQSIPPAAQQAPPVGKSHASDYIRVAAVAVPCLSNLQGGVLQLSSGLLSGLSAWSTRSTASSEELQLAAALLQDFGAAGPAPAAAAADGDAAAAGSASRSDEPGSIGVGFEPAVELRVVADRTQVSHQPCQAVHQVLCLRHAVTSAVGMVVLRCTASTAIMGAPVNLQCIR
jgi:hypothetical protein